MIKRGIINILILKMFFIFLVIMIKFNLIVISILIWVDIFSCFLKSVFVLESIIDVILRRINSINILIICLVVVLNKNIFIFWYDLVLICFEMIISLVFKNVNILLLMIILNKLN